MTDKPDTSPEAIRTFVVAGRTAAHPYWAAEAATLLRALADEKAELVRERDEARMNVATLNAEDALWRQKFNRAEERAEQAEADAAAMQVALHNIFDSANGIMPIYKDASDLMQKCIEGNDARWTRLYAIWAEARAALSSTAGRDLLARMERMRSALVKLHHVVTCHVIEYTNARALRDAVAGAKAALADQQGEKT